MFVKPHFFLSYLFKLTTEFLQVYHTKKYIFPFFQLTHFTSHQQFGKIGRAKVSEQQSLTSVLITPI